MNWLLRWPVQILAVLVAVLEAYRLGNTNTPAYVHATWSPQRKSEMRCVIRPCYHTVGWNIFQGESPRPLVSWVQ
jgi:hypothetical protein